MDDSLRISIKDGSTVKIQKIEVKTKYKKIFKSEKAEEAETRLKEAEGKLAKLTDEYKALKEEERFYQNIRIAPIAEKLKDFKPKLDPAQWKSTLDYIQISLGRNHGRTQKLLTKIDEAREELTVAIAIAERNRSARSFSRKEVNIILEAREIGEKELELSYRISRAGWYPVYTARVLTAMGKNKNGNGAQVSLVTYALCKNETGEDWKDVDLSFSAADPYESAELPLFSSWLIKAIQRPEPSAKRSYGKMDSAPSSKSYASKESMPKRKYKGRRPAMPIQQKSELMLEQIQQDTFVQKRVEKSLNRSRNFYQSNQAFIREDRAQRKSEEAQRNIEKLQVNLKAQSGALERGDYNEAMRRSDLVLGNINKLSPRFRKFFTKDIEKANETKKRSLAFLETQKLIQRLVSPMVSSRGYDYRYHAKLPESIVSDGAFHKVFIFEKKLPVDLSFQTVPLKKSLAFLVGGIKYTGKEPLLSGPLSVFHNTDYIGESSIQNISPEEPFSLHLGSDEAIRIIRRESDFRITSGLLSKSYSFKKNISIVIQNKKGKTIDLDLFDRIPVSTDEKITISEIQTDPPATEQKKSGLYRFRMRLGPGEEKKISIQYQLTHPVDIVPIYQEKNYETW
jgi:hypothetical protein